MAFATGIPLASADGLRATVVHMPVVPAAAPLAQYPKVSVPVEPTLGVYVKVPLAQIPATGLPGTAVQLSVPLVGETVRATPYTLTSFAITPFDGSVITSGVHGAATHGIREA